jgi:hypothetical protein
VEKSSLERKSFAMNATSREIMLKSADAFLRMQKVAAKTSLNVRTMTSAWKKLQREIGKDGEDVSKDKSGMHRKR